MTSLQTKDTAPPHRWTRVDLQNHLFFFCMPLVGIHVLLSLAEGCVLCSLKYEQVSVKSLGVGGDAWRREGNARGRGGQKMNLSSSNLEHPKGGSQGYTSEGVRGAPLNSTQT